jgi:hypothetical protein
MSVPTRPRLRLAAGAAISCLALMGLSACGDDATDDGGSTGESGTSQEQAPIEVTIEGDTITPAGERVEVSVGEPVVVEVTADRSGELHVHSTPEQEIAFTEGTTEHEVLLDRPGVVEVESHDPDLVILQLEAR